MTSKEGPGAERRVTVVTDSSACIPPALATELGIIVVPIHVIVEGRSYEDGINIMPSRFYEMLRSATPPPTTAAPNAGDYLQVFENVQALGGSVCCLCAPRGLTSMHSAALLAKGMLPDLPVEVISSSTAAGAQGLVAIAGARMAVAGASLEQVAAGIREAMLSAGFVALLDTLEYLRRGGRVPRVAAMGARLIDLKPLLTVVDGEVQLIGAARTRHKAVERLLDIVAERLGRGPARGGVLRLMVQHAAAPEEASALAEEVARRFAPTELHITEFTPVMGAHTGPGLLGIAYHLAPAPGGL